MMTNDAPQTTRSGTKRPVLVFCSSVILLVVGLIAYIWTQPWAYRQTSDSLGMAALPTIYLAIAGLASVARLLVELRSKAAPVQQNGSTDAVQGNCPVWPVVLLVVLILAGTAVIWRVDPIVMCSGMVLILMLVAGIRDWRLLAGVTFGNLVLLYLLFVRLVGIYFPTSWLQ